jgi:hypothetical protein
MIVEVLIVFLEAVRLIAETVRVTVVAMIVLAESLWEGRYTVQAARVLDEAAGILVKTMRMAIEAVRMTLETMRILFEAVIL